MSKANVASPSERSERVKRLVMRSFDSDFAFDMPLSELKLLVDTMVIEYGEDARFSPTGYENYGSFEVKYKTLETDNEFAKRIEQEDKKTAQALAKKRAQFEKLKAELGEV